MRRMTVLVAAGVVAAGVGVISFTLGRALPVREPVAAAMPAKVAEPQLLTGTIASRPIPAPAQSQAPSAPPVAFPPSASPAASPMPGRANAAAAPSPACSNPDALGVSRVVEIDTAGGPGFGLEQYKAYDFLEPGEVVLTFDDGPWPGNTPAVLSALAAQCTKALFFPIGKHAIWHPEILKQVAEAEHTIGSHTWSHADLSKLPADQAKDEIEKGVSAVRTALGQPAAPFFRFPALRQPQEMVVYLGQRNIGIFSTDMDSLDFKIRKPEKVIASVMTKLKKRGKGIVLLHDFQHATSEALPQLLVQLKTNGYKIVHVKARDPVQTLADYDSAIMKEFGGNTVNERPLSTIVHTISGD
jgi:peptidoglycan/xylan/chitin deacetylase (PgdA/CDA1 family)